MTDRELLELAARAAGYGIPSSDDHDEIGRQYEYHLGLWVKHPWGWGWFRPHIDDGQSLRLAAKLNLSICYTLGDINAPWGTALVGFTPWDSASPIASVRYQTHEEKTAATRLAITRAAAQIQLNKESANE